MEYPVEEQCKAAIMAQAPVIFSQHEMYCALAVSFKKECIIVEAAPREYTF